MGNPIRSQLMLGGSRVGYKVNLQAQAKKDRKKSGGAVPPVQPPLTPKAKNK
jgi:hypothetical protein